MIVSPAMAQAQSASQPAAQAQLPFLLQPWTGPHGGVPPWDKVQPEQFPPAFEVAFADLRAEIRAIANNPARWNRAGRGWTRCPACST
jgi:peptidyl-dipeptidase Dcp